MADAVLSAQCDTYAPAGGWGAVEFLSNSKPHDSNKPKKVTSYGFHIEKCDYEAMQFQYCASDDHPLLTDGGLLKIISIDDSSSSFNWSGKYRHANDQSYSEKQGDVFAFFLYSFLRRWHRISRKRSSLMK